MTKYAVKALIVHFLAKVVVCQQCCAYTTCDGERGPKVYVRYKCVWHELLCLWRPQPKKNQQTVLPKHPFSIYTKKKSGIVGIIKIRKGVALPLGPVWCWMSGHTRWKEKSFWSFWPLKKFCHVNVLTSPHFVALYLHGSRPGHPPNSKTWLCYFWTKANPLSSVWVKTSGKLGFLAYGIVYSVWPYITINQTHVKQD